MEKKHIPHGPYEKYFKRPIDFCCGLAAVVVFCWLYVIIAIFVRIKLGSPVLFTQERPGKDGKNFKMYKFRTMSNATDEHGQLLPDIERLTKFGRFLRSTSLDELPEAFNIIKGDMSVIGPRPLAVQYLPYYNDTERHEVLFYMSYFGFAEIEGLQLERLRKRYPVIIDDRTHALNVKPEAVKWNRRKNLIFPSVEALAKTYPVLRKCKLLLPFVWVLRWIKVLLFRRQNIRQNFAKVDRLTAENIMNRKAELNYVGLSFNFKIEE